MSRAKKSFDETTAPSAGALGIEKLARGIVLGGGAENPGMDQEKLNKLTQKMNETAKALGSSGMPGLGAKGNNYMKSIPAAGVMPSTNDPNIQLLAKKMIATSQKDNS